MAEVATGVLHNVGNILNSVNVSTSMIKKHFTNSPLKNLQKATDLISQYEASFADFVKHDHRGQKLPKYLITVSKALRSKQETIDKEFHDLAKNVEHIKEIIAVQQTMAKSSGLNQELRASDLLRDVMTANKGSLTNHHINVTEQLADSDLVFVSDKHRILQILINLVRNAKDALVEAEVSQPTITLRTWVESEDVCFEVADNGVGIDQEHIHKIFQHGFTTKTHGHGFGLHSSANAATEVGGRLCVISGGIGRGSQFVLRIPIKAKAHPTERAEDARGHDLNTRIPTGSGDSA
jgi:signal transduction histidine kinase